jgi:hypothetical protein
MLPSAKKPPHEVGKEWWTTPPIAPPQPEHIEYVVQFQIEVMRRPQTPTRDALLKSIAEWLRAARRLLHEEFTSRKHADLNTADGLFIAVRDLIEAMTGAAIRGGFRLTERDQDTLDAPRSSRACTPGACDRERQEVRVTAPAPPGAIVGLYVDLLARVYEGDLIETRSGRRYLVLHAREQQRGKHAGRQHLRCSVLAEGEEPPLAPNELADPRERVVHRIRWYRRPGGGVKKR